MFRHKPNNSSLNVDTFENSLSPEERSMLDFIKHCLNIDPNKRMTCEEAIRHDWFKDLSIKKEK